MEKGRGRGSPGGDVASYNIMEDVNQEPQNVQWCWELVASATLGKEGVLLD